MCDLSAKHGIQRKVKFQRTRTHGSTQDSGIGQGRLITPGITDGGLDAADFHHARPGEYREPFRAGLTSEYVEFWKKSGAAYHPDAGDPAAGHGKNTAARGRENAAFRGASENGAQPAQEDYLHNRFGNTLEQVGERCLQTLCAGDEPDESMRASAGHQLKRLIEHFA